MARPPKERRVENIPEVKYFKPAGIPMREIEEISLNMEEIEAIRLKDLAGLTQQEASEKMEISRPTFQRILTSAREKIAQALIKGKGIRFQGGDYRLAQNHFHCHFCGNDFDLPPQRRRRRGRPLQCPSCGETLKGRGRGNRGNNSQ